ncbi:Protein RALF-like 4 [Linum grandiflorum]
MIIFVVLVIAMARTAESSLPASLAGDDLGMQLHAFNTDSEFMMDNEINHRMLKARQRYISYKALAANNIPCGRKGNSYYDCSKHQRVNPYRRGCTAATGCYRWTH